MGTLEHIRKTSPYVLAVFALLFVAFMVASDADISNLLRHGGSSYQTAVLATINGDEILYKDFENRVREQIEQKRKEAKDENVELDEVQIRQTIFDQMVNEVIVKQEAKKAGIFVSNEEVLDVILGNPPDYLKKAFTDTAGVFQRETYLQLVTNPDVIFERLPQSMSQQEKKEYVQNWKNDLLKIEFEIRKQKLYESLSGIINTSGGIYSPDFIKQKFIEDKGAATASYIFVDIKAISDSAVTVSDEEIKKVYEDIKKFHEQKARKRLKYIAFQMIPSDKDTLAFNKVVKKIADDILSVTSLEQRDSIFTIKSREYKSDIFDFKMVNEIDQKALPYITNLKEKDVAGPIALQDGVYFYRLDGKRTGANEVVQAGHILIQFGNNKDSARQEANKIYQMAKSGQDFAGLCMKYSKDPQTSAKAGDLGYFGKGRMVKEFEDPCFAAPIGSIAGTGPIETNYGFHIIKVTDKKSEEIKYTQIKLNPNISKTTEKDIWRQAQDIKKQVESGQSIDTIGKNIGKKAVESPFFEQNKPVISSNYLSSIAFEKKVGNVLEPILLKQTGVVVSQISDERAAGFRTIEDLKQTITKRIQKTKKLDMIKARASEIYAKVQSLDSLTKATQLDPTIEVKTLPNIKNNGMVGGFNYDYAFTSKVYLQPIGKIAEPVRGELGYYIIQVLDRSIPELAQNSKEYDDFAKSLKSKQQQPIYYPWFSKIKEDAKIVDFRNKFFREY